MFELAGPSAQAQESLAIQGSGDSVEVFYTRVAPVPLWGGTWQVARRVIASGASRRRGVVSDGPIGSGPVTTSGESGIEASPIRDQVRRMHR